MKFSEQNKMNSFEKHLSNQQFQEQVKFENVLEKYFPDKRTKEYKEINEAAKKVAAEKLMYFFIEKEITLEEIVEITGIDWWEASGILKAIAHWNIRASCTKE